ncbi:hypothetical protein PanWU01x14_311700 [Parasponia andersonii]|uniref:Membrane protein insertion efficiency factor n=1 Tax=Parasponia andersonii TaxID=3476 RepID=A0A2P5APU9_PARAD|nr:hypothetical protein PanWU01x14_311700 [Parasponia andersonii]
MAAAAVVSYRWQRGPMMVVADSQSQKPKCFNYISLNSSFYRTPPFPITIKFKTFPPHPHKEVDNLGVKAALSMLKFYKREISPILPKSCRFVPSCSEYSMEAYKKYGVVKGTVLTAWRLCRCNPLGGSGFDPPRWFDETNLPEEE